MELRIRGIQDPMDEGSMELRIHGMKDSRNSGSMEFRIHGVTLVPGVAPKPWLVPGAKLGIPCDRLIPRDVEFWDFPCRGRQRHHLQLRRQRRGSRAADGDPGAAALRGPGTAPGIPGLPPGQSQIYSWAELLVGAPEQPRVPPGPAGICPGRFPGNGVLVLNPVCVVPKGKFGIWDPCWPILFPSPPKGGEMIPRVESSIRTRGREFLGIGIGFML